MKEINAIDNYTSEQMNTGAVQGIAAVYCSEADVKGQLLSANSHTTVELSADISAKTFVRVLEFLYSGLSNYLILLFLSTSTGIPDWPSRNIWLNITYCVIGVLNSHSKLYILLNVLYCAIPKLGIFLDSGVPRFPDIDDILEEDIHELERVAGIFKLSHLQTICKNIISEQEFLNPSIGTYLNDETGARMKQLFFNQPDRADVVFNVEG